MAPFRWGILGTGFVAKKFVLGLRAAPDTVTAVASLTIDLAKDFARSLGIPRACGSAEELAASGDVDAIYVATPNHTHHDLALLCLRAGKPVLVEKPFALDSAQAREIVETARDRKVFCMEGMWTRFLPLIVRVKRLVADGALGDVRMVSASFCLAETPGAGSLFNAALGGGALLDRGVYLISLAVHLMGPPDEVLGDAITGEGGVDEEVAMVLRWKRGGLALLGAGLRTQASNDCLVMGTRAQIRIHSPIFRPFRMTQTAVHEAVRGPAAYSRTDALRESHLAHAVYQQLSPVAATLREHKSTQVDHYAGNGYHYEAEEVARCVRGGSLESAVMPLADSLEVMRVADLLRAQWRERAAASS